MRRALPLLAILVLQGALLVRAHLANHPQWMVLWDCVGGAMAEEVRRGFTFSPLDAWDGVLGGLFVGALWGSPLFALAGISGGTLKGAAVLWCLLTTLCAAWLGHELGGRRTAWAAAAITAFPPPVQQLGGAVLGQWHYTEIAFDFAAAALTVRAIWGPFREAVDGTPLQRGPQARGTLLAAGSGLLAGAALFNCFGSLIFQGAMVALLWGALRRTWQPLRLAVFATACAAAVGPMIWKVLGHVPYGATAAHQRPPVPKELIQLTVDPAKALELLPGGGFAWGLLYGDAFGAPRGTVLTMTLSEVAAATLLLAFVALLALTASSVTRSARALISAPFRPEEVHPAAILAWMGLTYGVAFFLSDMDLRPLPWYLTNQRQLGLLILIPWSALLGLCLAMCWTWDRPLPRGLRPLAGLAFFYLVGLNAAAMSSFERAPQAQPDRPPATRGRCYDVFGFYLAPYLDLEPARAQEACLAYGTRAAAECWRGASWAIGFHSTDASEAPIDGHRGLGERCHPLPEPWRDECFRGVGWSLVSGGEGGLGAEGSAAGRCEWLPDDAARQACWRGVGFPLGDHLAGQPQRLMRALLDFPPLRREDIAEGAALPIGRTYERHETMVHQCSQWAPEWQAACSRGVDRSLLFRGPDAPPPGPGPRSTAPGAPR